MGALHTIAQRAERQQIFPRRGGRLRSGISVLDQRLPFELTRAGVSRAADRAPRSLQDYRDARYHAQCRRATRTR